MVIQLNADWSDLIEIIDVTRIIYNEKISFVASAGAIGVRSLALINECSLGH